MIPCPRTARCNHPHRPRLTPGAALVAAALAGWAVGPAQAQPTPSTEAEATPRVVISTTIRKKLETVQDVPATVSVLSGADLDAAGVTDVRGIEYKIPGLMLGDKGFDGASIGLRGASSLRGFTGDEAAVAVHLDGIYIPQSGAALGRLFDVSRVETLYGPQGSLYGRNAVTGVIDIVSNAPARAFGGNAEIARGSFGTTTAQGVLNVPLSETSGLRFAVSGSRGDGFVRNVLDQRTFGNDDFTAGRVRYRGQLTPAVLADITLQASQDRSTPPLQPGRLSSAANKTQGVGWRQTAVDAPVSNKRTDSNLAVKFDVDLGALTLRSITGYNTYSSKVQLDSERSIPPPAVGAARGEQDSKAWSQELNVISGGDGPIDWRVGAYLTQTTVNETRNQDDTKSSFVNAFGGYDNFKLRQEGSASAAFGALDWKPAKGLTLSIGARYNHETKEQSQDQVWGTVTPSGVIRDCSATGGGASFCRSADKKKFSWNGPSGDLTAKWQLDKNSQLYGRAARGFRSGAIGGVIALDNGLDQLFFGPGTFGLTKLKPETLNSLEFGTKNTLMGGQLLLNAAVYRNIYKDQLVFTSDPVTFRLIEGNVGESKYTGLDLAGVFTPSEAWRVDFSVSYLDAEITQVAATVVGAAVGNKPIYAPRLSSSIGISYRTSAFGGVLAIGSDFNHKDRVYFDLANAATQGPVDLVNLWASLSLSNRWKVFASVNNAMDKEYFTRAFDPRNPPGPGSSAIGAPRTYRIGAGLTF